MHHTLLHDTRLRAGLRKTFPFDALSWGYWGAGPARRRERLAHLAHKAYM
ncbi:hypothetical protein ACQEVG_17515 [Streptomyces sp. CA-135486]